MEHLVPELIKHREICFCSLHPDPAQARTVTLLLSGVDGVLGVTLAADDCVRISYDLSRISLHVIEDALLELGFHLDNGLLAKLKRALYYYTEEVQCTNRGCRHDHNNATLDVFIHRYQHLPHGCRDDRPEYWRRYL